jgi:Bacterial aa3 type cytochrome c oxidase subunit IV
MADKSESTMDMKAHEAAYEGFIHLTVLTVAFCIAIVIMLAIGNAGSWGLAGFGTFLAIVGAVIGFVMKGSPIPIAVFTLGILVLKLLFG